MIPQRDDLACLVVYAQNQFQPSNDTTHALHVCMGRWHRNAQNVDMVWRFTMVWYGRLKLPYETSIDDDKSDFAHYGRNKFYFVMREVTP